MELFMQNFIFMPLNLNANEANRIYWNEQYFSVEGVLLFPKQIESVDEALNFAENCTLILKLTPFKNQLRSKMLASLANMENTQKSNVIGITVELNITNQTVTKIADSREVHTTLNEEGSGNINPQNSHALILSDKEYAELKNAIETLMKGNLQSHLRQPFVSFIPDFADEQWKERLPKKQNKSALIPYQAAFPFSGNIERMMSNTVFAMDDLYCVNPQCQCNEVTCIVLTFDPQSGREVTYGGFKYNFEKKSFKNLPNFPNNFNAQEWFKQFSKSFAINLALVFQTRYNFLRKNIQA
jgi:hypothetical protein